MKPITCTALFATLIALAIPRRVEAHGIVTSVQILGGTTYTGPKPGSTTANKTPIRQITDQGPIHDLQSKDMICGQGATPGSAVASAKPGDSLVYSWGNVVAADGHWIHNVGPMMTYMAQVPTGQTADKYDGVGAQWFKTDQAGKKNGQWVQASLMTGATFKTQIPETLADGDYLVRHEIIALHTAANPGGAEFYPSCFQLRIKNSNAGNATVTTSKTLSFPGAYSPTDPGILVNVFDQAADGSDYVFPAGPIANVTAPGATGNSPNAVVEVSSSSAAPEKTTAIASATSAAATTTATSSTITSTSTSVSASASSVSSPVPTADLAAIRLANGRTAQELNLRFKSLSVSDRCQPRDPGCIGSEFAVCTPEGTWSKQGACFSGASCLAVPLKNINGTQVGCFPEAVAEQAMIDSGAGRALATETASSAPVATQTSTSASLTTSAASSSSTGKTSTAVITSNVVTASTLVASSTSSVTPAATTSLSASSAAPTTTSTPNVGGAPAVVIGVGSKPARRMLRWERRSFH